MFHPPPGSADLSSYAHYWYSSLPTSKLRVGLQVGAGDIGIYYLKEPASQVGLGSAVECWVDDNYVGAVVIENAAQIAEPTPAYVFVLSCITCLDFSDADATNFHSLEIIDHYVARGSHYIECQLLGEEDDRNVPPFKIIGIFST